VPVMGTIRHPRGERGQALIIMVMAMTVMFVIGAIAVDVGLWLSERRGSQTDADFVALSGAWALLDPAATEANAVIAVNAALAANDEQLNASLIELEVDMAPVRFGRCVSVDVGHESRPLFFSIFGVASPDIGAHAMACTGAANVPGNLVPFQIDNNPGDCFTAEEEPRFTSMCPIEMGAQGGNPRGMLDMEAPEDYCSFSPGAGDIEDLIINSAPGICLVNEAGFCDPTDGGPWYDCVAVQTGNPKKVIDGVAARLAMDGDCDGPDAGGVDDFDETINLVFDTGDPFTSIYEARDCDEFTEGKQMSSRLVSLIVLEDEPIPGNTGYPILAFAAFYIAGCAHELDVVVDESDLDRYCGPGFPEPGRAVVYGRFVNLIFAGGGIGDPTDQTTVFGIALVE